MNDNVEVERAGLETYPICAKVPATTPKRICMVVYSFYLNDSRVRQYATALSDRGDHVEVIALRREREEPITEVVGNVVVHRIQERRKNERGLVDYASRIVRFFFKASWTLARLHRQKKFDLVHVHSVPDFLVLTALMPKLTGTPVILDIHDILPEFYASKFGKSKNSLVFRLMLLVERLSVRFADHVIVANGIWRDRIAERCRLDESCSVVRNYPDPRVFFAPPKVVANQKFTMVYPGSLNQHQGVDVAIRAFRRVSDKMPDAEFHIYGEGPDKEKLIAMVRQFGLQDRVLFHEFLPVSQIVPIMAGTDLAVVPKRASNEFGNEAASTKILEFMMLGVAVIVTRTRIDSLYFDETMVRFFESDNDAQLADEILLLYQNPAVRAQLAKNGLEHARQNGWPERQYDYLQLVDRLAQRPA